MNNNKKLIHILFAVLLMLSIGGVVEAKTTGQPFMTTAGKTSQPIGHYEFCRANRSECSARSFKTARAHLTPKAWNALSRINNSVNQRYEQVTDLELFGRPEVWAYPKRAGDCEDLVLQKRRDLIEQGWPQGALLITVVRQANGDGHAVLTVLTDRGDLILDNLEPRVLVWNETNLHFVKRQSENHTGSWTAINDDRALIMVGSLNR